MYPLDNVIWYALTTRQTEFAVASDESRRFMPEVTALAALREPTEAAYLSLAGIVPSGQTVIIFLDEPFEAREEWSVIGGTHLLQMVCDNGGPAETFGSIVQIVELGAQDSPEMKELAALTKPGPFGSRTHELGTYLGIRREGKLVAMAGERLKVEGHTEVSAVCTHPEHLGKGYAGVLMGEVMGRIRQRGEIPFLHVRGDNVRAVALYERLGFHIRRRRHYVVLRKL